MKKILVALTFLSLLFCGSQAYALDTGNAVVTNDTIGSDSIFKAPEIVTNAQGDIVNTPEYKAVLTIINDIKNLSNQTQGNNFPTFRMRSFFCNIYYCGTKPLPHSENPTHSPFSSTDRCRTFSACIFVFSDLP